MILRMDEQEERSRRFDTAWIAWSFVGSMVGVAGLNLSILLLPDQVAWVVALASVSAPLAPWLALAWLEWGTEE